MKKIKDWSLMTKILVAGIFPILILSFVLFFIYLNSEKKSTVNTYVEKARAICLTGESTRQEMEDKWSGGVFTIEQIKQYLKLGQKDKVLSSVPVVSAWRSLMRKADEGDYIFRVPKFSPRNPENAPDYGLDYQIEGPALKKIKEENLSEYYVIDKNINAVRYFLPVRLTEICLICHGEPKLSKELWGRDDGKDPTGGDFENWQAGEIHGAFEIIQSLDKADSQLYSRLLKAGLLAVICIFFSCVIYFMLARSITRSVAKGVEFAKKMSQGDLSQTLNIDQNDEIGVLSKALNNMVFELSQMFKDVSNGVNTLSNTSNALSDISEQMANGAEQTSGRSHTVAAAAEEMSVNMNSVAAAVEEASTNISIVASSAEEMSATINEIAHNAEDARSITNDAVTQAISASENVNKLGDAAKQINKVTEVITQISEQTNLLALNATIEAARAGESGKGFAVVANEIKELAKQTAEATQDIRERIHGIQNSTIATVDVIENITQVINKVSEIVSVIATAVEEQSTTTKEIAQNISEASQGITEVTENVAQSSSVSVEISKDIADVNLSAEDLSKSSAHINISAKDLAELSVQLKQMVNRFKLNI